MGGGGNPDSFSLCFVIFKTFDSTRRETPHTLVIYMAESLKAKWLSSVTKLGEIILEISIP
jgi:hypothetical protein